MASPGVPSRTIAFKEKGFPELAALPRPRKLKMAWKGRFYVVFAMVLLSLFTVYGLPVLWSESPRTWSLVPKAGFWNDSLHSMAYTSLTEGRGETVKARMFAGMLFLVTFTGGGILFDSCIDQAVAQTDKAVAVSLCELLANPLKYAGWTVSVRARVETSYHFVDLFDDENCTGALLLEWPKNPSDLQRDAA